ncbi:uncharacterized protein LOC112575021 isoform X2 [Pomacea canaliculata]|uniref:uncharacterized protein LOC112575021 isoform X2 n=1 Tax=Pomacea canaliculata TaxID=400727 RepID=UPI000D73D6A9|nr:uncharacterized protein LOC112575021 isoform X2 [Pomacea canaliculata]XP_025112290.1 uncharacterized protein LOC112575021 isoform X2 [Pomacea canaliculata]
MGEMVNSSARCSSRHFLVVIFILRIISRVTGQDNKVTCDVPSVTALTSTSLTCNFPEDISQTRKDVSVYLYKESENPDAILDCWWLGGHMDCYSAPGYKHTKSISRQLTVTIPRAAANQTGTYACQVAGYGPDQLRTCDFKIQSGTKTICDAPSVRQGSPAWLSCYFSENVGESKRDFSVYHVSSQGSKETTLTCTWSQGTLTCHNARDYQFDRRITNTATVKIPKVSASHTGTYSCQLAGAAPRDYEDCVLSLDQGPTTSCNIPSVKLMEPATLTCNFSVDINKTKTNFNIVHFNDQNKAGVDVLKCVWQHVDLLCDVTSGLEFSRPVTDQLALTIPRANDSHAGNYSCHLQRTSNNATYCELVIVADSGSNSSVSVVVGVLIPLFILVLIVVGVLLYRRHQVRKKQKTLSTSEDDQPMLSIQTTDQTTQRLQESLSVSIQTMYPDILTACYFVPSLYINRNMYRNDEVAGEKVVVMEAAPDDTLRHDHAIQHVLNCLRHLADRDQQAMFVLSQFTCDDYLASVDEQFAHHKLPMPSDLRRRDKNYENFDVLIVHRQYGVVVVVVKASVCTADIRVEIKDFRRVVQDLRKAVKQLDGAERMLKHLMADVRPDIAIRKTLMLPNLSLKFLKEILGKHQDVEKGLRDCTGLTHLFDISAECLCSDQLQSHHTVDQLHNWLKGRSTDSPTDPIISESYYLTILSRFCGAATRPYLTLPDGRRVCTPSSLQQAVSLTGELFNGAIIHPEHQQLVTEAPPRVFVSGPPGSGKTTSLVLMGKQWLSEGHKVCVLSTWRENRTSSRFLHALLKQFLERSCKSGAPADMHEYPQEDNKDTSVMNRNPETKETRKSRSSNTEKSSKDRKLMFEEVDLEKHELKKIIEKVRKLSTEPHLLILVDDAGPCGKENLFKSFCHQLFATWLNLNLWAASCYTYETPKGWNVKHFRWNVSCPPAILREKNLLSVEKDKCKTLFLWHPDNIRVAPTEGLPVKYVKHYGDGTKGHNRGHALACDKCCRDVIHILTALLKTDTRDISDNCKTGSTSTNRSSVLQGSDSSSWTPRLDPCDVLVLFEHELCENKDFRENTTFFKTLQKSGFSILSVENRETQFVSQVSRHHLWVANAAQLWGFKNKIVIYLEQSGQLPNSQS